MLIDDFEMSWSGGDFLVDRLRVEWMESAGSLGTLDILFKEKDQKEKWRLDELFAKYSVHECQDPRDKVYRLMDMVPAWQRPVVGYAKSTYQVFLDVVPIVLNIYWENKPTEATCKYERCHGSQILRPLPYLPPEHVETRLEHGVSRSRPTRVDFAIQRNRCCRRYAEQKTR